MNKTTRFLVKILAILTLIIGSVTMLQANAEIIKTSGRLLVLRDNASYYNEQYRKTDAMTEEYLANNAERQKIYNSEDVVVRVFSNQNTFVKLAILVWALASFILIPYMWLVLIAREISRTTRKHRKSRHKKSSEVIPMNRTRKSNIA